MIEKKIKTSFDESKTIEDKACEFVIPYFVKMYWDNFEDVRMVEEYWKEDIDFFVNGNWMEMKAFKTTTQSFLFELKREDKDKTKQWNLLTSQAEYWLVVDNSIKTGWLFKLKELQMLVLKTIKNKQLENTTRKLYKIKDNWEWRYSWCVWIRKDYIISHSEFIKIIDFNS